METVNRRAQYITNCLHPYAYCDRGKHMQDMPLRGRPHMQARKTNTIEARLAAQQEIKASEALLKRKQTEFFAESDRIEEQKDRLTEGLEQLLTLHTERQSLFTLRWKMI